MSGSAASQAVGRNAGAVSCDNAEPATAVHKYCGDGQEGRHIGRQEAVMIISAQLHAFTDTLLIVGRNIGAK
jgi:hypothetical protein